MKKTFLILLFFYTVLLLNAQVSKTININTAGSLSSLLTSDEKNTITNLTITGNIDARDFKTMRDEMLVLAELDMSETVIRPYIGTEGTHSTSNINYQANDIPMYAFYVSDTRVGKRTLRTITIPSSATSILMSAFMDCTGIVTVNISPLVNSIGSNAFSGCSSLNSVVLPPSITSISYNTFRNCISLTSINIPPSVNTIGEYAFSNCTSLNSLFIPPSVTSIAKGTFESCISLTTVDMPFSVSYIGNWAFRNCRALKTISIPPIGTLIGEGAFSFCESLTSVNIPITATTIEKQTFAGCTSLVSITIPSSVTEIKDYAFSSCGFKSLIIPESVTNIGVGAFSSCSNLTNIKIPLSVAEIKDYAFSGCGFKSLIIPESVTNIGASAFENCRYSELITIPSSVKSIGEGAFKGCRGLITVDTNNPNYSSIDGVLFNKTNTSLICCPTLKTGNYQIPSTVVTIGNGAFFDCIHLNLLAIYNHVTSIGTGAFENCSGLSSIFAYSNSPVDLNSSLNVFSKVSKVNCTLNIPVGSKTSYESANQWRDFENIKENGFWLSAAAIDLSDTLNSTASIFINSNINWEVSSDLPWLSISPSTGAGNDTLIFTAEANLTNTPRIATVTISGIGMDIKTITAIQDPMHVQGSKVITVTAGNLSGALTPTELYTITDLTIKGTIDARDFVTMRDSMPSLSTVNIKDVSIVSYTGKLGPFAYYDEEYLYTANQIPTSAFCSNIYNSSTNGKNSLTSIILPSSIIGVNLGAFAFCLGLTSISIPSSTRFIGNAAFYWCRNLSSIQISSSVKYISIVAFGRCNKLSDILIPRSVTNIDIDAFSSCGSLIVDENNPNYLSVDGNLFDKTQTTIIHCSNKLQGSYTIPSSVSQVKGSAFFECANITSIVIPNNISSIGSSAFSDCSGLTSIYIGKKIPLDLTSSIDVFRNVNKTTCTLYVPYSSIADYQAANQWKDFANIVEMSGFKLSKTELTITATAGSTVTATITANINWTASSDQPWLTVSPTSSNGDETLIFTATANPNNTIRTATVTISAVGVDSQTVTITQDANSNLPPHFTPIWTGNGQDHMNFNVVLSRVDGIDLQTGDEIAVYDGSTCVGAGKLSDPVSFQNALTFVASKDDGSGNGYTAGNPVVFKIWDLSEQKEYTGTATYFNDQPTWSTSGVYEADATCFVEINAVSQSIQAIRFSAGWNIISAYLLPENKDLMHNMHCLIDAGKLVKVQDERGKTLEDWGMFGGWKNQLGDVAASEGYKVKVNADCSLELTGTPIQLPYDIDLSNGWNIISFPHTSEVNGMDVVQVLVDAGKLVKVQDEKGQTIEDWGMFGGWKNLLGNFKPGEGYKVKVNQDTKLTINSNYTKSMIVPIPIAQTIHFTPVYNGNGTDHMDLNMVDLPDNIIQEGDEIAAFDKGFCVGSVKISERNLKNATAQLIASAKDETGSLGFTEGNKIELRLWKQSTSNEYDLSVEFVIGSNTFEKQASSFICMQGFAKDELCNNLKGSSEFTMKCFPNPTNGILNIRFSNQPESGAVLQLFDPTGKKLITKIEGLQAEQLDLIGLAPGCYYLMAKQTNTIIIEKVIVK